MRSELAKMIRELMVIRNHFDDLTDNTPAERMRRYHAQRSLTELLDFLQSWAKEI